MSFELVSSYQASGDQRQAIDKLVKSVRAGNAHQTLLGVTGSGKTFTMANIIEKIDKPTLIMSHNKTLAAQLYSEFKNFFPHNAVEYFVSYFDYYQPEAYIPRSDTYIEKDSSINDEIERLRLSTMGSLLTRKDTIVIASVSCIYGLGSPEDYQNMMFAVSEGQQLSRDALLTELVTLLFERNDVAFARGKFRVRGDVVEIHPAYLEKTAIRVEFFGDEIERISSIDVLTGAVMERLDQYCFFPAKQFVTPGEKMKVAMKSIRTELEARVDYFEKNNKLLEAQRIRMRTEHDLEMMNELGFCQGIENYARHITQRNPGDKPYTLLDFFPEDFLLMIDESHVSIPQIGGMYEGDKSRKTVLVEHGFRLPSALDNRPLKFDEFMQITKQRIYVSATPAVFELVNSRPDVKGYIKVNRDPKKEHYVDKKKLRIIPSTADDSMESFDVNKAGTQLIVEQIIRPTGLLDPVICMRPLRGQIDETIELCRDRVAKGERVLVTTLTKKTAEDLTEYLLDTGLKVRYIHADVDTIERVEILRSLRAAAFDILVGINLLREGLDLPEVSLVCILDADKEGFLRNDTALIQTAGRAARHINGTCYLFCDTLTESIQKLLDVTESRRIRQMAYNEKYGITPRSVERPVQESLQSYKENADMVAEDEVLYNKPAVIQKLEEQMRVASSKLDFELAAHFRDQIKALQENKPITTQPVLQTKYKVKGMRKGKK